MTEIITTGQFKGGVGKTVTAVMLSYTLARLGNKTLLIDFDPQADATDLIFTTMDSVYGNKPNYDITFYKSIIENQSLESVVIEVNENLSIIPSHTDLLSYPDFVNELSPGKGFTKDRDFYLRNKLKEIQDNYDYIIIDVPPTINNLYTDSAIVASDYIIVVLQTQMKSYRRAIQYVEHLGKLNEVYDLELRALGVLPVLFQNGSSYDKEIIKLAHEEFGSENIFKTSITQMDRIKRFDWTGITNNPLDQHDRALHNIYEKLATEVIDRIDN